MAGLGETDREGFEATWSQSKHGSRIETTGKKKTHWNIAKQMSLHRTLEGLATTLSCILLTNRLLLC